MPRPPNWLVGSPAVECPALDDVAAIRYNGQITASGSADIQGDPNKQNDNSHDGLEHAWGTPRFNDLKAMATKIIASGNRERPGAGHQRHARRLQHRGGEQLGRAGGQGERCFTYFPILYHYGDLSISGTGAGQGILLVEGNLSVQGRIDFYGPVIATGGVNIRGTGSDDVKFYGGVMAQDVTLDDTKLTGNATINYSSLRHPARVAGLGAPDRRSPSGAGPRSTECRSSRPEPRGSGLARGGRDWPPRTQCQRLQRHRVASPGTCIARKGLRKRREVLHRPLQHAASARSKTLSAITLPGCNLCGTSVAPESADYPYASALRALNQRTT